MSRSRGCIRAFNSTLIIRIQTVTSLMRALDKQMFAAQPKEL